MPDWIDGVQRAAEAPYFTDRFNVDGLGVVLKSVDPSLVHWVMKYLQPLSHGTACSVRYEQTFFCLYSDALVSAAISYLNGKGITTFRRLGKGDAPLTCARISRDLCLFCNPRDGIFWLADFEAMALFIVFSSRTKQPAIEFARAVRDTVTCYLEHQGWASYHAGAVDTADGALMIVGNSGAGKTSLILALLHSGARYIANERLFVREERDGCHVMGYPMAIAVGLGTALQFPGLADLVENPDQLLYPRHRYRVHRVMQTPKSERSHLDDKLQLIPEEIVAYVGPSGCVPGAKIRSIVVPRISRTPVMPTTRPLKSCAISKVLSDNFMGHHNGGIGHAWSEMDPQKKSLDIDDHSIERLSEHEAVRFHFSLSAGHDTRIFCDALSLSI